jgi:hypothetical protein
MKLNKSIIIISIIIMIMKEVSGLCGTTSVIVDKTLYTFDISSLNVGVGQEYTTIDVYGQQYYFNFCDSVSTSTAGCSNGAGVCQKSTSGPYYNCGQITTRITTPLTINSWIHGEPVTQLSGVTHTFNQGDAYSSGTKRMTSIHVLCDKNITAPTKVIGVVEVPQKGYTIYMTSPLACPVAAGYGPSVLITDPSMSIIWKLDWNGTSNWTPLLQQIKTPGITAINVGDQTVYWTTWPPSAVNAIFMTKLKGGSGEIKVIDTTKLPSSTAIWSICAGSNILGIQYGSDKMAMVTIVGNEYSLIWNVQEPKWMLPRCAIVNENMLIYLRLMNSEDKSGQLSYMSANGKAIGQLPSISNSLTQVDFKPPNKCVIGDNNQTIYWGEWDHMDKPVRSKRLTMEEHGITFPLKDLTIDEYGMTYGLDGAGKLFSIDESNTVLMIPIPQWLTIGSLEGI